ncbi:MAG: glycosyltransferase family 39 protein [Phycisphaerales bacterium]|nr:glycosyltransferase family 39 protein [Phycisphaerales bacterium]
MSRTAPDIRPRSGAVADGPGTAAALGQRRAWGWTVALVLGLAVIKLAYLWLLSPYELVGDEAQYWDWSRRPDLSYYSKGPGIAWLIGAARLVLGDSEAAVRTPAVLAHAATALVLGGLATRIAGGNRRAGFFAAAAFSMMPVFIATSMLMTIDGPYVLCWAAACLAAWSWYERRRGGRPAWAAAAGLGLALGVGFLIKYTILLLIPGLVIFAVLVRRSLQAAPGRLGRLALCAAVFGVCAAPVIVWNAREGWPTVAHLLGHAGVKGGDVPVEGEGARWSYNPLWTIEFVGAQVGLVGPLIVPLFWAARRGIRRRARASAGWVGREGAALCVWASAPILLFYVGFTLVHSGEANWPMSGFVGLTAWLGVVMDGELVRYRALVAGWLALPPPRPRRGMFRGRPETLAQVCWHWGIVYGLAAGLLFACLPAAHRLPWVGGLVPIHRLMGQREMGAVIGRHLEEARRATGAEPFVMTNAYFRTALMAYYVPGRPPAVSGASRMGQRRSSYDFFADTRLDAPGLVGRPAVLLGTGVEGWRSRFIFDDVMELDAERKICLGLNYRGPRPPSAGGAP